MGVSIHYRGRVADIQNIKTICDELAAIADRMDWDYTRLDEDWTELADSTIEVTEQGSHITGHLPLKGISLTLNPKYEALPFFFDSNGNLCDPISLVNIREGTLNREDAWISVKTQYAGPETHIWIIGLLKYLKKFHLPDLEVQDEGAYWETGNFEILKEKMDLVGEKIAAVATELSRVTKGHIESFSADELASVIEALLRSKFHAEDPKEG
jgi:hypothetical protein